MALRIECRSRNASAIARRLRWMHLRRCCPRRRHRNRYGFLSSFTGSNAGMALVPQKTALSQILMPSHREATVAGMPSLTASALMLPPSQAFQATQMSAHQTAVMPPAFQAMGPLPQMVGQLTSDNESEEDRLFFEQMSQRAGASSFKLTEYAAESARDWLGGTQEMIDMQMALDPTIKSGEALSKEKFCVEIPGLMAALATRRVSEKAMLNFVKSRTRLTRRFAFGQLLESLRLVQIPHVAFTLKSQMKFVTALGVSLAGKEPVFELVKAVQAAANEMRMSKVSAMLPGFDGETVSAPAYKPRPRVKKATVLKAFFNPDDPLFCPRAYCFAFQSGTCSRNNCKFKHAKPTADEIAAARTAAYASRPRVKRE